MSYVAVKGGSEAIDASRDFYHRLLDPATELDTESLAKGLVYSCDRIMGEGALYSEKLAAEAIKRCGGDLLEAAFYLRAHRSTCQRIGEAETVAGEQMALIRRISSTFKEIEGGQILGPSADYVIKLFTERPHPSELNPPTERCRASPRGKRASAAAPRGQGHAAR